ncbi:MAG: MerR family transcriptional regulator [Fibrobacteres bacterium]|nr:MerR family transcriptional regulator [Fibrobacterota bacterium]
MTKANLKRLEEGKLYYSISEVCAMTGLEQHVLRYWESEFPQLRPKKNRSGNRAYRAKEIKIIRYIKYLLYEEMYTIPGAKKKMADANMSDLDGQLTLLRVPATPAPVAAANAIETTEYERPVAGPVEAAFTGETLAGRAGFDHDGEASAEFNGSGLSGERDSSRPGMASEDETSHAGDGGEAAARLREELRRVKQELQSLLAALASSGSAAP